MSSASRAARRREAREAHRWRLIDPDANFAVMVAWCATEDDLEDARKLTHDAVIRMMGDRRTGPVQWLLWTGDDARTGLDQLVGSTGPGEQAVLDHYRRVRAHLREYGGWVVVAMAEGEPDV